MKQPRLCMETRRGHVIRNADFRTKILECVKRPSLGRPGICRRKYAQLTAALTMGAQSVEQRSNAASPYEGHHEIYAISRVQLGQQLIPNSWLARRIRQQRRVEQRDQWLGHRLDATIRSSAEQCAQNRSWFDRSLELNFRS